MNVSLTVIAGPDAGRTCELTPGSILTVGRGNDCGLQLSDPGVSRLHCRFNAEPNAVKLEDAGSRFGTLINRRPVFVQKLLPGDTIEIGDTKLRFNREASAAETIPPTRLTAVAPDESTTYEATEVPAQFASTSDAQNLVGTTFVRFRVESVVSSGASGVVYRAIDVVHHHPVALKVFWPSLFKSDAATARFLRAMRTMIPLEHDHLIKLHAAGRSAGLCFTASEFVAGESVAQMVSRIGIAGMLDWRTTWRIARGLTEALAYLHERQILHRSLRPGNILIRASDHCAKIGDSLLAKSLDQLGQVELTNQGDVVGDILYLSPEQLSDGAVDQRADLYSLGATLYALLTGRPPFVGRPAEVVRQILTVQPEHPTTHHLAIPGMFESIVLRMLAKRPEDRYPDALTVRNELIRVGKFEGLADL